jgi:hypothetical protein
LKIKADPDQGAVLSGETHMDALSIAGLVVVLIVVVVAGYYIMKPEKH